MLEMPKIPTKEKTAPHAVWQEKCQIYSADATYHTRLLKPIPRLKTFGHQPAVRFAEGRVIGASRRRTYGVQNIVDTVRTCYLLLKFVVVRRAPLTACICTHY